MPLREEILSLFPNNLDINQISEEAIALINKVSQNERLSEQDLDILLNPTEVAALLSAKYQQTVNHRYIKEITRSFTNPKTGHTTPARLVHDKVAGRTYLYKVGKVLDVKLRKKTSVRSSQEKKQDQVQEILTETPEEAA